MQTLYLGLESDKNGSPLSSAEVAYTLSQIKKEAARLFGGYSATIVQGGWINAEGDLVEENALRLELAGNANARAFAQWCGALLNQSCVLVASTDDAGDFVDTSEATTLPPSQAN